MTTSTTEKKKEKKKKNNLLSIKHFILAVTISILQLKKFF